MVKLIDRTTFYGLLGNNPTITPDIYNYITNALDECTCPGDETSIIPIEHTEDATQAMLDYDNNAECTTCRLYVKCPAFITREVKDPCPYYNKL